jgi:outer membrane protein assembly factor BamB
MSRLALFALIGALSLRCFSQASAEDWPAWRGKDGNGVSNEKMSPTKWSTTENVKWKIELDGDGNSTPIIVGEKLFLTHAPKGNKFRGLWCLNKNTGELLWKKEVAYEEKEPTHGTNPMCSSSAVSDGERVIAWYGSAGLYCYDLNGNEIWKQDTGKVEHIWGWASSPLIHQDLVFLNVGPGLNAYVVAFNKTTGKEVWRKDYPDMKSEKIEEFRGSWSTPVLLREGDQTRILLTLPSRVFAVKPESGEEVWSSGGLSKLVYTSPLIAGDTVIAMCGYGGPAIAVRAGGEGDVTETHRLWEHKGNPQRVGSGIVVGEHIFILNEPGIAWCLVAKTGEKLWEKRLGSKSSWSSMCFSAGKLYATNMDGHTFVMEPDSTECKIVQENEIGELTRASLAFSGPLVFQRTYKHLYCFEQKQVAPADRLGQTSNLRD